MYYAARCSDKLHSTPHSTRALACSLQGASHHSPPPRLLPRERRRLQCQISTTAPDDHGGARRQRGRREEAAAEDRGAHDRARGPARGGLRELLQQLRLHLPPEADAHRRQAHGGLPRRHPRERRELPGQGRARRGRRQRHPEHLGGEGRREEGDRVRVHGDGGARAAARRGERPRKCCRRAPERRRGVGFRKGVGGYHHQRVDGLFLAAGVDARLRDLRAGPLFKGGGRAVPVAREDVLVPRGAARR